MEVVRRFLQPPSGSFFLFGPRGTGKSTWLQEWFGDDALLLDLLDPSQLRAYLAQPERLRQRIDAEPSRTVVVVDEVQKVPALLDVVHGLIEQRPQLRFVLTGSSARKLRRGAANLLAGRLVERSMHPFLAAELGPSFDLNKALRIGLVPLVWQAACPADTLAAYVSLYLTEEVQAEALVRQIGDFSRFLEVISFSQGSQLNLSAIARDAQIDRKRVEAWLLVLEDLLLCFRLPVFSRRAKRQLVRHEKFYLFDVGVFRSLRPRGPLDAPEEIEGLAIEGLVAQHLRAWAAYRNEATELMFWRTKSGREVDFVLYGADVFMAIEVKRSSRVDRRDLAALKAFGQDYPEARLLLVTLASERLRIDGVDCLPLEAFLLGLDPRRGKVG
jgi:predicted AAA+ superfamily ATPase